MRAFTDILREIRNGKLVDQASRQLREVVEQVEATGKAGSIVIELKVKPGKDEGEIAIVASSKMKRPEADIPEATFFMDADGNLVRNDPRQMAMRLSAVEEDPRTKVAANA